jgi:hypothetical protein
VLPETHMEAFSTFDHHHNAVDTTQRLVGPQRGTRLRNKIYRVMRGSDRRLWVLHQCRSRTDSD